MTNKPTFDYREFMQKGFDTLDDDFLNEHFGSSEASTPSSHKSEIQSSHREYATVKTLGKNGVKLNSRTICLMFNRSKFSQHLVRKLTQTQQEGLKSGRGYTEVRLMDSNTGKSYNTKLVVQGEFYFLKEIGELTKDRQLKENQQIELDAHDGALHFKCL